MTTESTQIAGILLLTVVAVAWGGAFLLRLHHGREEATPFQRASYRAGHAHAGVLVLLSLVVQPYVDAAGVTGPWESLARQGVPLAAILMPAGFFLGAAGRGRTAPNRWRWLVPAGAVSLVAGVVALGAALLQA